MKKSKFLLPSLFLATNFLLFNSTAYAEEKEQIETKEKTFIENKNKSSDEKKGENKDKLKNKLSEDEILTIKENMDDDFEDEIKGKEAELLKKSKELHTNIENIKLKEQEIEKKSNLLAIKKNDMNKKIEELVHSMSELNDFLVNYQATRLNNTTVQYIDMILSDGSLFENLYKVVLYRDLSNSMKDKILAQKEEYQNIIKEIKTLEKEEYLNKLERGAMIYEKEELEKEEKSLKLEISLLETKERIRMEFIVEKQEKEREEALKAQLLNAKKDNLGIASRMSVSMLESLGLKLYTEIKQGDKPFIKPSVGVYTSPFGWRDIGVGPEFHAGLDIAAPAGTPIYAAADGVVTFIGSHWSAGNYINVTHNIDGTILTTRYLHLNAYAVSLGDTVKQGELIALMGSTGRSTGPHLHFEVRPNQGTPSDTPFNPIDFIR